MSVPDPHDPYPRHGHRTPAEIADETDALGPVQPVRSVPPKGDRISKETKRSQPRISERDKTHPSRHHQ